ncbi:hypothetical protein GCM10010166_58390 [Couchioplanes caeruleus subsp. azureus]|nr:DUF4233 domain-containing protein [Couchioplanes caeruleus]GGQ80503.1 hypothetical protein GCM10010166_58390 [Couchioplanes caeruleus subsp. azureus]
MTTPEPGRPGPVPDPALPAGAELDPAAAGPGTAAGAGAAAAAGADGGTAAGAGGLRSGLRNPEGAVRGLGSGTLALEAIVLLLAIQPIRIMGGELSGWGIGAVVGLALAAAVVAGSMRRSWAWHAGTALQVLLLASGLLHWSLAALGLIFGAAWVYATYVRRTILG